jgi:hypothetical protein
MRTSTDHDRGQALAEFALVVPIFLLLLFGIIDLGRLVYTANALSNGAREAARAGSVGTRPPECNGLSREVCIQRVAASHAWGLPGASVTTDVDCERWAAGATSPTQIAVGQCRTDDLLAVRSSTGFTLLTPIVGQFIGEFDLSGDSKVTVHQ